MIENFDSIVAGQIRMLSEKGYNENKLNSFNTEDDIRRRIADGLTTAVLNANKNVTPQFFLPLTGFFDADSDVIRYLFYYRYLPLTGMVQMTDVTASMQGLSLEITIADPDKDLRSAEAVYRQLRGDLILAGSAPAFNPAKTLESFDPYRQSKILQLSSDNTRWLIQNGYIGSSIALKRGEDEFTTRLRDQLVKFHHFGRDTPRAFVLNSGRVFDDDFEKMHFRVFYRYDSAQMELGFRAIRASLGQQHNTYLFDRSLRPPPAEQLYQALFHLRRTATARRIIDHQFAAPARGLK